VIIEFSVSALGKDIIPFVHEVIIKKIRKNDRDFFIILLYKFKLTEFDIKVKVMTGLDIYFFKDTLNG